MGLQGFADYEEAAGLLNQARRYAAVPLLARPAADALEPAAFGEVCQGLYHAGAEILGADTPAHMAALSRPMGKTSPLPPASPEDVLVAADDRDAYFLNEDDIIPSQPFPAATIWGRT